MKNPSKSEIEELAKRISSLFVVSDSESLDKATSYLALAYSWGKPPSLAEFEAKIKRDLGKGYQWRSEAEKRKFEESEKVRIREQEIYVNRTDSTPRFRI